MSAPQPQPTPRPEPVHSESESKSIEKHEEDVAHAFNPGTRFYLAWSSLMIIVLMAALDATSLSVALSKIAQELRGSAIEAFWAGTSFLLTGTVFQPVVGSLSGIFGRKPLLQLSLVFFLVGAIVAALAGRTSHGMAAMLVGRSIQGIGGGGVIVLAEILPTDLVPLRLRGNYMATIGAMWAFGSVGGPLIGGAFASGSGSNWPWIFWINLPFIAIGGAMMVAFLQLNHLTDSLGEKLRRVDYVGMLLFIGSTTGFLIPLTWGGVMYSWSSWHTLVPLLTSAAGLVAFIVWEERFAVEPLIPLRITKNWTSAATYLTTFLHGMVLWCLLYYGPLYFEAVKGYSPLLSGVALFPSTFTVAPASVVVGVLVTKTGRYRWSLYIGWFLATLGFGLQYLMTPTVPTVAWVFFLLITGLGTGLLFPGLGFSIQAATSEQDTAPAVALFTFMRTFGQAIGVAVGGVVFQNAIKRQIASRPLIAANASQWAADSSALVQMIHAMPEGPIKVDLIESYADALKVVWAVCCGFAGLALLLTFLIKEFSLDRQLESKQQFVDSKRTSAEVDGVEKA
ncbi:Efflux pump-like protein 3 [Elsinoe fawcettii]|nr:Efflux pump-like protein 3 [Elsinoe fawcettii]